MDEIDNDRIREANIEYHSALAETYDEDQPHFKKENIERVDSVLKNIAVEVKGKSILDLGCGTGFILNIAKKYFKRLVGVDITEKMLDRVDRTCGNIELHRADTGDMPLQSGDFDLCTAYGFLHHLPDLKPTFIEAHRLLREGGVFYADLDPNHYYWNMIKSIQNKNIDNEIIRREVRSIVDKVGEISDQYNLDREIVMFAEYQKIVRGGFKEEDIAQLLKDVGFTTFDFKYVWYLGQVYYIHNETDKGVVIEEYLRSFLPSTRHLFKYISFTAKK